MISQVCYHYWGRKRTITSCSIFVFTFVWAPVAAERFTDGNVVVFQGVTDVVLGQDAFPYRGFLEALTKEPRTLRFWRLSTTRQTDAGKLMVDTLLNQPKTPARVLVLLETLSRNRTNDLFDAIETFADRLRYREPGE